MNGLPKYCPDCGGHLSRHCYRARYDIYTGEPLYQLRLICEYCWRNSRAENYYQHSVLSRAANQQEADAWIKEGIVPPFI